MQPLKTYPKPVQLIRFDQAKNIHLTPQAIDIFTNKLNSKQLCIVCVAGKYRTGKSYILNRVLLNQNNGFEVGPTINACTKGLWMWPEIVKINANGNTKECIVIDTEGLGSLEEGQNTDLKIFLMAMLLSSYLIYNSVGNIDEKALQSLNLVISMAQLLQKSSDKFDSQQLINSFPSFMWLVRDFALRLQDQQGEAITSQQYLENALKTQIGKSAAAQKKNQVRKQLKRFFTDRDCFTLIRPTLNEKDLQNLSTLSQKKLRPEFIELIKQLRTRIHNSIPVKKIRGKPITPQGFIELCNYYITNINSGKLPSLNSHWDNLCISESGRLVKKYEMRLKEFVEEKIIKDQQVGEFQLKQFGQKLLAEASETVEKSFLGKLQKKLLKQKLAQKLNHKLGELFDLQFRNQEQLLENQVKQLFEIKSTQEILIQPDECQQVTTHSQNYNFYHKIDSMKQLIIKFSDIMSKHIESRKSQKSNYKFMHKIYEQCFDHLNERFFKEIEEDFYEISSENLSMKTKMKQIEDKVSQDVEQGRIRAYSLRDELEQSERNLKKASMMNEKLEKNVETLRIQNRALLEQIEAGKNKLIEQQMKMREISEVIRVRQQKEFDMNQKVKTLQTTLADERIKLQSMTQEMKQFEIRQRKMNRECEIYKQKIIQKQEEIDETVKEVEELKCQVASLEREKRKILRNVNNKGVVKEQNTLKELKTTIVPDNHQTILLKTSKDQALNHCPETLNKCLQPYNVKSQQQQYEPDNTKSQQQQQVLPVLACQQQHLQPLLSQVSTLQLQNNQLHQSNKHLTKQLHEQQTLNSLLVTTPQSLNYQSLKKNYEIQKQFTLKLTKKITEMQNTLKFINRVQCESCGEWIGKNNMFQCDNVPHWVKCINSRTKAVDVDVSYIYNADGEINFLFQVTVQTHNGSGITGINEDNPKPTKWSLLKSLKSITLFLKRLNKATQQSLFIQPLQQQSSPQQQSLTLNQQRRLYLDQLCQTLKPQLFTNNLFIEFFAIDLHILRNKKFMKKERSFVRKRKVLDLDLAQIIEETNQRDNTLKPCNRALAESVNLMRTSKFSLKKVFKFGPNV